MRTRQDLVDRILRGDRAAAADALRLVDDRRDGWEELLARLYPHTGRALAWGVAGSPGCGKSTLVDGLIRELRRRGKRVGVVAVDPTSALSGGAILGDRVRMQEHSLDEGVFIRSAGTRGGWGGISPSTLDMCRVLDAAGMDVVIVETVGIGQDETDIRGAVGATALVLSPDTGDSIQLMKAGIMEVADVFVVNKGDLPGAAAVRAELGAMLAAGRGEGAAVPPVVETTATSGAGVAGLADALFSFAEPPARAREKRRIELERRLAEAVLAWVREDLADKIESGIEKMGKGEETPYGIIGTIRGSIPRITERAMQKERRGGGEKSREVIELTERWGARNYKPLDVVLARGEGCWVWDADGNRYMDMLSAYSALNQGHRHPRIIRALEEQAGKLTLTSRAFHNELLGPFCMQLAQLTGMETVLPMNTGAEAVETAVKVIRKWAYQVKKVARYDAEIVVFTNNFHGRTTTVVSFSSEEAYRRDFGPFTPGFTMVEYGDIGKLEAAITPRTAAVLVEPIQGEAGIIIPPEGYLTKVRRLCRERGILLALDEIQTGFGRTGKLFCWQHEEDARPDLLIMGKALGGGVFPVSAVASDRGVLGLFTPGEHGSTFGGNPLACAVAMESVRVIVEEGLVEKSDAMGRLLVEKLRAVRSPLVREVRGRGLLVGVELKPEAGGARRYCEALAREGLLCKETHDNVIRFAPPLVITREEIDWAMERIGRVLGNG